MALFVRETKKSVVVGLVSSAPMNGTVVTRARTSECSLQVR
jgi:hypothetical protein